MKPSSSTSKATPGAFRDRRRRTPPSPTARCGWTPLDTLEHVPTKHRHDSSTTRRVSDVVILKRRSPMSPSSSEAALHEFVLQRFGGPFRPSRSRSTASRSSTKPWRCSEQEDGRPHLRVGTFRVGWRECCSTTSSWRWACPNCRACMRSTTPRSHRPIAAPSYRHVVVAAASCHQSPGCGGGLTRTDVDSGQGEAAPVGSRAPCCHIASEGACGRVSRRRSADVAGSGSRLPIDGQIARLREANDRLHVELQEAREAIVREARRSISSVVLQRAADWRARRRQ